MKAWLLVLALAAAGSAAATGGTAPTPAIAPAPRLADAPPPPAAADILAIPPALRDALHRAVNDRSRAQATRLELLSEFLFDRERGLGMAYDFDATLTVAEAWQARRANCLTFTLLTVALAREAGIEAYGQRIDDALAWQVENDHIIRSNHVNTGIRTPAGRYTFDVAADTIIVSSAPRRMTDDELLAAYHGNRAMELVLAGAATAAVPFVDAALALDPRSADILSNAGVVATRTGDPRRAERHYLEALARNGDHWSALANLTQLYERRGERARAALLRARSERVRARDPFHQFVQGNAAEAAGDDREAAIRYRHAIRLHPAEHRFHFALARTLLHLGRPERALQSLARARELAAGDGSARYQAKLDVLQAKFRQ